MATQNAGLQLLQQLLSGQNTPTGIGTNPVSTGPNPNRQPNSNFSSTFNPFQNPNQIQQALAPYLNSINSQPALPGNQNAPDQGLLDQILNSLQNGTPPSAPSGGGQGAPSGQNNWIYMGGNIGYLWGGGGTPTVNPDGTPLSWGGGGQTFQGLPLLLGGLGGGVSGAGAGGVGAGAGAAGSPGTGGGNLGSTGAAGGGGPQGGSNAGGGAYIA